MKNTSEISVQVIKRLPRYHRYLEDLRNAGVVRISSKELSQRMGLTASQIRQDLNCFGGFGQQGYGYNIEQLYNEIGNILGMNKNAAAILIGAGNLGKAIATHLKFDSRGFDLIGVFEKNTALIGQEIGGITVTSISELENFCKEYNPTAAILCIPADAAKDVVAKLVSLGVKGFWNFTHYDISHYYDDVSVENVHLGDSLMTLRYQIKKYENSGDTQ